jgi:hypothetical protein
MAKTTTNKSLRPDRPIKALRRQPIASGETDDANRTAGASGTPRHGRKRPGRAASLRTSNARKRSERWRSVAKGKLKRRANPVRRAAAIRARAKNP